MSQRYTAEMIEQISHQIKLGVQHENPSIELKREFWDLSSNTGKEEYAKDLTVFANSQYGAGDIIVGIDGDTGDICHTTLPIDAAKLVDIISSKVMEPFSVEFYEVVVKGQNIVIVHIPRSFNKPHILRSYKQREMFIPIRKGTRTVPANKYDLDLMYSEREKEIIPPYRLEPFIVSNPITINTFTLENIPLWSCIVHILNTGSRVNLLTSAKLVVYEGDTELFTYDLAAYFIPKLISRWQKLGNEDFIKVDADDALRINLGFFVSKIKPSMTQESFTQLLEDGKLYGKVCLTDVRGTLTQTEITLLKRLIL
ncbi:ATP-binding protein [Brevibacillus brevis X23]|nr:ATP-binding protein [Brevibacillus brevis X23]